MSRTLRFEPLVEVANDFAQDHEWPWTVIGVLPTQVDSQEPDFMISRHNAFTYTTGLDPCVWMPMTSIEGRFIGPDHSAFILNVLALATRDASIRPRDSVLMSVGCPGPNYANDPEDFYDADAVLWIGDIEPNDHWRQTFQTSSPTVLPILWSSPLGWME